MHSQRGGGEGRSLLWGRSGQRTAGREPLPARLGLELGQTQRVPYPSRGLSPASVPLAALTLGGRMRQPASRLPLTPPGPLPNLQDAGCGVNPMDPQERRPSHPPPPTQIMQLLMKGNRQRTQEPTAANRTSSRSHAVLQVAVRQRSRVKNILQEVRQGRLFMIDLAGSERASQVRSAPPALGRRVSGGRGERRDADLPASAGDHGGGHPRQGGGEGAPLGQGLRSVPEEHDGKRGWVSQLSVGKGVG